MVGGLTDLVPPYAEQMKKNYMHGIDDNRLGFSPLVGWKLGRDASTSSATASPPKERAGARYFDKLSNHFATKLPENRKNQQKFSRIPNSQEECWREGRGGGFLFLKPTLVLGFLFFC